MEKTGIFKVQINDDKENGVRWLRITHSNVLWESIRIDSDDEAEQIIHALQQSVKPTVFGAIRQFGRTLVDVGRSLSRIGN